MLKLGRPPADCGIGTPSREWVRSCSSSSLDFHALNGRVGWSEDDGRPGFDLGVGCQACPAHVELAVFALTAGAGVSMGSSCPTVSHPLDNCCFVRTSGLICTRHASIPYLNMTVLRGGGPAAIARMFFLPGVVHLGPSPIGTHFQSPRVVLEIISVSFMALGTPNRWIRCPSPLARFRSLSPTASAYSGVSILTAAIFSAGLTRIAKPLRVVTTP